LLGILDKGTLTLGDNRRVDFSKAMIFMTSNLGATEMNALARPNLGFAASEMEHRKADGIVDADLDKKISRAGIEAARRKFTPEFMNRIDKLVVFHTLGAPELRKILDLELSILQQRIFAGANTSPFVFSLTGSAKDFLLREGTDLKYGARHLKRAIERNLVHPLSNLMASDQLRGGDLLRVDFNSETNSLDFVKLGEDMPAYEMIEMVDPSSKSRAAVAVAPAEFEYSRVAIARSQKSR
jgi:ATP-dependent Clp protease ATP-binding subunit ClpA